MRIAGACMIFTAFICAGLTIWHEKKRKLDTLGGICFSLELMYSELAARSTPLSELVAQEQKLMCGSVRLFYTELGKSLEQLGERELSELWSSAAEKTLSSLASDEMSEFKRLGGIIGRYDLSEQLYAVNSSLCFFRTRRDAKFARSADDRKLTLGLAAAVGALLAIVVV